MKQPLMFTFLPAGALLTLLLSPAEAQLNPLEMLQTQGFIAQSATQAQDLQNRQSTLRLLQSELKAAQQDLRIKRERFQAGQITQDEVAAAGAKVEQLEIRMDQIAKETEALTNRANLQRPVNIQMDRASVQQFATALSKATDVPISVDKTVPADASTMLTIDAQQVPLASVLEAIAQKADLMIAPDGRGVILKRWPHLNDRVYRSANAPWSADWGVPPTFNGSTLNGFATTQRSNQSAYSALTDTLSSWNSSAKPSSSTALSSAFTMTHLSDHLIAIAEPGRNAQGEAGVWLTAYTFEGTQFKKVGTTFHRLIGPEKRATSSNSTLKR